MIPRGSFPAQAFTGNTLDRTVLASSSDHRVEPNDVSDRFLPVAGRNIFTTDAAGVKRLQWFSLDELRRAGLGSNGSATCDRYLLGRSEDGAAAYALDVTPLGLDAPAALGGVRPGVAGCDLRGALLLMLPEESAIAGQAVALSQWHQAHRFCPQCGSATESIQSGSRRQCVANSAHRQYPRTDPVVIMLVESVDGSRALLGRSKSIRAGMLTALSGFVDQCESVEEAVRREVFEEVGIRTGAVDIVGTQPWPIGRGGSCELMIGAVAKALHDDITLNTAEMEDARWFSKAELQEAVAAASDIRQHPYTTGAIPAAGFFVPPPIAIAHHLIKQWANEPAASSARL